MYEKKTKQFIDGVPSFFLLCLYCVNILILCSGTFQMSWSQRGHDIYMIFTRTSSSLDFSNFDVALTDRSCTVKASGVEPIPLCTRDVAQKHVTSGGLHLRSMESEQHNSEETPQRWRAVRNAVSALTDSRIELSRTDSDVFNHNADLPVGCGIAIAKHESFFLVLRK